MNPFEMVVLIVAIVMGARVLRARYQAQGDQPMRPDTGETQALRHEIANLKDRIAVLERLATDTHDSVRLDREIERLRGQ